MGFVLSALCTFGVEEYDDGLGIIGETAICYVISG